MSNIIIPSIHTFKNEMEKIFERLRVKDYAGSDKRQRALWNCKCECGNNIIVSGQDLRSKNTRSCGCLYKFKTKEDIHNSIIQSIIKQYRDNAKRKNLIFDLYIEDFKKLIFSNCFYCNDDKLLNEINKKLKNGTYTLKWNGIDRINNNIGYIKSNVVPSCKICNYMKKDMNLKEFYLHIEKIKNSENI